MSKKKRTEPSAPPTPIAVLDPPAEPELFEDAQQQEEQEDWELTAYNDRVGFFDLMPLIPEQAWEDSLMIYLYRLSPPVNNQSGEKKYIGRYTQPIDEDMVKRTHGGGRYHALLKRGKETLKQAKFSVEGEPILLEGQVLRGGAHQPAPGAPGAGPSAPSDLVSVVRQVIEATKGDQTAANAGIEVLKSAMKDGLALNKSIVESQMGSATGNKVGDKVLDLILPRLLDSKQPDLPPIVTKVLEAAISTMKNPREPATTPADPMQQFTFVKELLGVDSIKELFDRPGRGAEQPFWVPLVVNAIEKLPTVLQSYGEMQERAFQRALIAHQVRSGTPAPLPGAPGAFAMPATQASPGAQAAAAPPATAEQQAQQMVGTIVEAICRAWDEGYPGDVAGAHLKIGYPLWVEQLKPLLADSAQLANFIQNVPALRERAQEPEWAEFQADLIAELNQIPLPAGAETGMASAQPGAAASQPAPPAPSPKKKGNGRAA